jgi:release factor glutamine methyltransferase
VALTAAGIDNVRFEARLLLSHAAALPVEALISRGRDAAPPALEEKLRTLTARRVRREPMAYILGEREFWGLPFRVSPAVLVPRPDSETVIEVALSLLADRTRTWRLLDLGLGSGCLLLTLLKELPNAQGVGLDISCEALAVARGNAGALGVADRATLLRGDWCKSDWTAPLGGPFDLVVSNPPYIEAGAIDGLMPEVARYEPRLALDGGPDGLAAYRLIAEAASRLVVPGGHLVLEMGEGQAIDITDIFKSRGFLVATPARDLGGIERVLRVTH